jgi:hypothetical protein
MNGKPEIGYLELTSPVEQDISWLQVSVQNLLLPVAQSIPFIIWYMKNLTEMFLEILIPDEPAQVVADVFHHNPLLGKADMFLAINEPNVRGDARARVRVGLRSD